MRGQASSTGLVEGTSGRLSRMRMFLADSSRTLTLPPKIVIGCQRKLNSPGSRHPPGHDTVQVLQAKAAADTARYGTCLDPDRRYGRDFRR